ncbi:hypothetical protein BCR34DRAFT_552570 [Clohesyomyces aquaticus]|uniref:Secreted protein n=1 Tax=Clohesyomyces aquaticus TaxID=1231657 RepID=A0A1Y2ABF8_9PLEO|nr:hypothetical protein BCR34DRAFT_552570 [Clohesyomyces aquaticus]
MHPSLYPSSPRLLVLLSVLSITCRAQLRIEPALPLLLLLRVLPLGLRRPRSSEDLMFIHILVEAARAPSHDYGPMTKLDQLL